MKLDSDDRHDTDYANKFVRKAEEIFAGLPKPKDWHTQEEIAGAVEVARNTVSTWEDEFVKISATDNLTNSPDFDPPIYNVWKQQTIADWMKDFSKKLTDDNLEKWPDFDPPIYNIWKQDIPPRARGSTSLHGYTCTQVRFPPRARGSTL